VTTKLGSWFVVALFGLPPLLIGTTSISGCSDKPDAQAKPELVVLDKAKNGSPVAVKFVKFGGEGEGRSVEALLHNTGDKSAVGYTFVLRYYDASDKLLKVKVGTPFESDTDFTSMSGNKYKCPPNENQTLEMDGDILSVPAEAVRAEIVATQVRALAADGVSIDDWFSQEQPFGEWPA
jgi:hypothetical protein